MYLHEVGLGDTDPNILLSEFKILGRCVQRVVYNVAHKVENR
jgi:hypothetical protein